MKNQTKRKQLICKRCGHIWLSKINPLVCPVCHLDWRFAKGKMKSNLRVLNNFKKQYGEYVTIKEILEDIKTKRK